MFRDGRTLALLLFTRRHLASLNFMLPLSDRLFCVMASLLVLWLSILSCSAHADLEEQIAALTRQLAKQGESATLYCERADLYRRHAEFDAALADVSAAERLQTNSPPLSLDRARILSDAGRAAEALATIRPFLDREPDHPEALIIRARSHARLGNPAAAVADYNAALAKCPVPGPDLFLERARQQAVLGKLADAAHGLDEAITNAPSFSTLQLAALDYDRQRGAFDSALARVDAFVARYPVKEPWLTLRAEVLAQAGRNHEAETTFQQVLAGIEKYPPLRRDLELTKQLEARARQGLARVQTTLLTTSKP